MKNIKIFLCIFIISSSAFAFSVDELKLVKEEKIRDGLVYKGYTRKGVEPLSLHLINLDLDKINIKFQLAQNEIVGRETVSSMAKRAGAIGGVNGGFFEVYGPYQGEPEGFYVSSGKILSEPTLNRSSFGVCRSGESQTAMIDQIKVETFLVFNGNRMRILGLNRERRQNDVVVYLPEFGGTTLTDESGSEIIVKNGAVSKIISDKGSNVIPKDGMVLSVSGKHKIEFLKKLKPKSAVKLVNEARSIRRDGEKMVFDGCSFTTAGPTLIMNGVIVTKFRNEKSFVRHPRTAIGIKDKNNLVIIVVDGRDPEFSVGMSLGELASFLKSQGVTDGYNLDGGGSTTLVLKGRVFNHPSDVTGERPVGDSILFFPRSFH